MRSDTGARLGIALSAVGTTIGAWLAAGATITGVQSGANTALEAGVFIGSVGCIFGLWMAFLAIRYRRLAKASDRF